MAENWPARGTVITSQGTFNPEDHWEESGAGQTAHVDHANVLYQIPEEETGRSHGIPARIWPVQNGLDDNAGREGRLVGYVFKERPQYLSGR